ncbi:RES family NAD+ phosphorylase [Bradyrhizobium sp. LMG 9283]|uniref:RES family NAD+ phosphorylase n=1 Tax=Bradyrhizobium sp. LMG 9283 TaxID=592064 RepID=UPI00388FE30C
MTEGVVNVLDDKEDWFGPAWQGWHSYDQFVQSVKSDLRYVRSPSANGFLDEVLASCPSRKLTIPKDRIFWRARLGCEWQEVEQTDGEITAVVEEDRPYRAEGMKPIPNWQSEGRANPRGIPCLYVADDRDTALAEVRPWIGATISLAQLQVNRELTVIDCSRHHAKGSFVKVIGKSDLTRDDGIWIAIDQAFATPVSKDVEAREYVATQILAELFKAAGFDGIVYKSLLTDKGYNLALFNLADADVINCGLYSTNSIRFDFRESGNTYFVSPKRVTDESKSKAAAAKG